MFRYSRVWLAEIKTVDMRVSAHREIFFHSILLIACYIIEDEDWVWLRLARKNVITVGERKVANFVDRWQQILQILIFRLLHRFWIHVYILETYRADFPKLMKALVLPQFEGPQTIARIVFGSIAPCLCFSALSPIVRNLSSQFITRIVNGCNTNLIFY